MSSNLKSKGNKHFTALISIHQQGDHAVVDTEQAQKSHQVMMQTVRSDFRIMTSCYPYKFMIWVSAAAYIIYVDISFCSPGSLIIKANE